MTTVRNGRVDALDGLRTLAILGVILIHLNVIRGGGIGVDVFFVLSGFVITRLLLIEHERFERIALRAFYARRFLRLAPSLLAMCSLLTIASLLFPNGFFHQQWIGALLSAGYVMDFVRAFNPWGLDNVGVGATWHTWSLGIEEQFYIVWPVLLLVLLRLPGRARVVALSVLIAIPTCERILIYTPLEAFRIYNAPDTRADQLLVGCLLAVSIAGAPAGALERARTLAAVAAWPALAALVAVALWLPISTATGREEHVIYTVGFLVAAVLAAIVIAALVLDASHPITRALGLRPIAWFGRNLSYGLYVWHYPIFLAVDSARLPGSISWVIKLLAALSATIVSYLLIERFTIGRRARLARVADAALAISP
jgi:peptidoglycan/LPS O-acetylase OafA/YrhL